MIDKVVISNRAIKRVHPALRLNRPKNFKTQYSNTRVFLGGGCSPK